jgi:3-hydroxyacyl-CoA dehydrogenase
MKKPNEIKKVAVLGCGFIGFSFAVLFSRKGLQVNLYNRKSKSLDTVKDKVREQLEFLRSEGIIKEAEVEASLARIYTYDKLEDALKDVDYVQEAMPEDLQLKQDIFAEVSTLIGPDVVIGSSCSGLRREDIVKKVRHNPERCLVAHPTNPPHLIPFMEISGDLASKEAKDFTCEFMEFLGQKPIQCKEVYGYVLNRVQMALIQEALYLVEQDICTVEGVERAITDGLGLRWAFTGPYGVEELNSENLREGLGKYKGYLIEGFEELGKIKDYGNDFINKAAEGFQPVMKGRDHDQYMHWRNKMVLETRKLKGDFGE